VTEPRKPIFGFLWAKPDPDAPVDAAYHQVRPVRVTGRGLVRVVMLVVTSATTVMFVGSALMAAVVTGQLLPTVVAAAVGASLTFLILRGWVVGTYVSDDAVRVETTFRRRELAWQDVSGIEVVSEPVPLLGLPTRIMGRRSTIRLADGRSVPTHVYTASPDLWLRDEAFDIARLRLERWSERPQ
jgi:hypothetical protein